MKQKTPKRIDPDFKRKFGIETPIQYLTHLAIERGYEERFKRSWLRFFKKASPQLSPYRMQRIDAFFRHLEKLESDDFYSKRITVRYINAKVGYGVFAREDIPPYATLHYYTGVFRIDKKIPSSRDSTFAFTDFGSFSIDASQKGNWTRFMNHGNDQKSETNVVPWEHYLEEGPRIVFTAGNRGIKKGKQLLYSYGDDYWEVEP